MTRIAQNKFTIMALHTGYYGSSKTSSSQTSNSDLETQILAVKKTADSNKSTLKVHDVTIRANENSIPLISNAISANTTKITTNTTNITTNTQTSILAKTKALANEQSITTHGNYLTTIKSDILSNETKANTNLADITILKAHFAYQFEFYYVNIAYNTWHEPVLVKLGHPAPWAFFETPTDRTKIRLMGHVFDDDTAIGARSRLKFEYKVKILKDDGGTEEKKMYYDDILPKKIGGLIFYINEEKTLKELFPSHYTNTHALQVLIKIHETGTTGNENILTGIVYQ